MKDNIILTSRNRDNAVLWLERVEGNNYVLKSSIDWVLEYMRFIYTEVPNDAMIFDDEFNGKKCIYNAIDPSGGPYISLGYEIENYKVVRFFKKDDNFYIVLDKIKNNQKLRKAAPVGGKNKKQ